MNNDLILEYIHFSKTTRSRFENLNNWENRSIKIGRLIQNVTEFDVLVSFIDQCCFKKFTIFLRLNVNFGHKKSPVFPFTRFSAKKVLKFTYLSISKPFSVVDAIVGFFKSQIFQKRIFWVVDKKRSHGHSLLAGDTPGRLQIYWDESQQLTINPTTSRHK